jgi:hypothetical protein
VTVTPAGEQREHTVGQVDISDNRTGLVRQLAVRVNEAQAKMNWSVHEDHRPWARV